jgi:hypothetical protein
MMLAKDNFPPCVVCGQDTHEDDEPVVKYGDGFAHGWCAEEYPEESINACQEGR